MNSDCILVSLLCILNHSVIVNCFARCANRMYIKTISCNNIQVKNEAYMRPGLYWREVLCNTTCFSVGDCAVNISITLFKKSKLYICHIAEILKINFSFSQLFADLLFGLNCTILSSFLFIWIHYFYYLLNFFLPARHNLSPAMKWKCVFMKKKTLDNNTYGIN